MYAQELVSIDASGPRPWVVANLIRHTAPLCAFVSIPPVKFPFRCPKNWITIESLESNECLS